MALLALWGGVADDRPASDRDLHRRDRGGESGRRQDQASRLGGRSTRCREPAGRQSDSRHQRGRCRRDQVVHEVSAAARRSVSQMTAANCWLYFLLSLGSLCWANPGAAQTAPSKWVTYDAASKTVTFALDAGAPGASGPFNFNGYSNGAATLTVPPGSTVVINFVNMDGTPHSAEIIADKDPMPN